MARGPGTSMNNSAGDRAIVEVNAPISWKRADRYFAASWGGRLFRITRKEIDAWIAISRLASVG